MNYRRIYNELIMKAWRRGGVEGYKEKHHIIPRCQGGGNDKANLVELTAAEHYIAHLLLTKMFPGSHKLLVPVILMASNIGINNKIVARMREKTAEFHRGRKRSKETCAKISKGKKGRPNGHKGLKYSDETKAKISASKRGSKPSEEARARMSSARKGKRLSDETKAKMSESQRGKTFSEESKAKMSKAKKGVALSEEHRAKISAANKGKKTPVESIAKMRATKAKNKERKELLQFWCAL